MSETLKGKMPIKAIAKDDYISNLFYPKGECILLELKRGNNYKIIGLQGNMCIVERNNIKMRGIYRRDMFKFKW